MLTTKFSNASKKFFKKLPPKHRRQVAGKVFKLEEEPQASDASPLRGYQGYHRADIGEHRIIYRWSSTALFVDLIGKRNDDDVYKKLGRMVK